MTHPTDDELEAMAVELQRFAANGLTDRAAAMLRACKGGAVRVKPLDLSNLIKHAWLAGYNSGSDDVVAAWGKYDPAPCPAYQRILSALEPAAIRALAEKGPDHE